MALSIEGSTRATIVDGAWSDIEEFELVTCLEADFDQAIYTGEDEPRADDCGAIPVVIIREPVGADGLPVPQPGAATTNEAEVWTGGSPWTIPSEDDFEAFGETSLTMEAWLEINSTDTSASTYKGINVHSPGSWFEVGVYAGGSIFDNPVEILDIYATSSATSLAAAASPWAGGWSRPSTS